jgi:phosphate-selective porin
MVLNKLIKAACLSACLGLASGSILANDVNVNTNGGLRVYDSSDNNHWFELTGQMQLDQQVLVGGTNNVRSSFSLSSLRTDLKGGIGQDTTYSFRLENQDGNARFTKARLTYSGFNSWSRVTLGQVAMPYGFDSGSSFLNDNMVLNSMKPAGSHFGIAVDTWNDRLGFRCAVNQPANATSMNMLNTSARLSFAPVTRDNLVVHVGLSGSYKLNNTGISADAAVLRGPVFLQAEYHRAQTSGEGAGVQQGGSVEASYALTGESRDYDYRKGSFSSLRTDRDNGSWEVSLRGSQLDSNRELGGSVAWTVNNNLKLLANYTHALQSNNGNLSLRLQAAW